MKKTTMVIALLLVITMALGVFGGCYSTQPAQSAPEASADAPASEDEAADAAAAQSKTRSGPCKEGPYRVGMSCNALSISFWVQQNQEFISEAEKLKAEGVISEYYTTNANHDVAKQISDIKDLMTKGCDIILIDAASSTALVPVVEECFEKGIRVASFDNFVDTENQTTIIKQDEEEFGRLGAQFVADAIGGKGKICILNATAGVTSNEYRRKGAESVFSQYPDIEILAEANGDCDYAKGKGIVESYVSAFEEIDAIWSQGGAMTQAAIDVFNSVGRPLVPMSGEGNNGFLRTWKENAEKGFSSVAPVISTATPRVALNACISDLQGTEAEPIIQMELGVITQENIDDYYDPELPDSYWCETDLTKEELKELYSK